MHIILMGRGKTKTSGIVLLMVLGILGLMSVLAVSFVSMARLERSVARNYVDKIRVQMAAESGVEKAISMINTRIGSWSSDDLDWMSFAPGEVAGISLLDAVIPSFAVDADDDGLIDDVSGIVEHSDTASDLLYKLRVEDESGKFNLNDSPGVAPTRMFNIVSNLSGLLTSDEALGTLIADNIFNMRESLGGQFSNMQQVYDAIVNPTDPTMAIVISNGQWERLRSNLTLYSWTDKNTLQPNPPGYPENGNINTILSPSGYELRPADDEFDYDVIPGAPFQEYLQKFRDEIYTVDQAQCQSYALEARSPVHLNTASTEMIETLLEGIQGYYIYEYGHQYLRGGNNGIPSASHNLNTYYGQGGHYAGADIPVDMVVGTSENYVSSSAKNYRPLLYDSFSQFTPGFFASENAGTFEFSAFAGGGLGVYKKSIRVSRDLGNGPNDNLVVNLADALWTRIHGNGYDLNNDGDMLDAFEARNSFRTWQEFKGFLYGYFQVNDPAVRIPRPEDEGDTTLPPFLPNYAKQSVADAILANFNPNSDLIDYNPNRLIHKLVDKAHLVNDPGTGEVGYTTEFCLEPTGVFSIECLGLLRSNANIIEASTSIDVAVELFRPYRMTTQAQFLGSESDAPLATADDFDRFLFPTGAGLVVTSGAGTALVGNDGTAFGYTMDIHPEISTIDAANNLVTYPLVGGNNPIGIQDPGAVFDGYIMPSTWQQMDTSVGLTRTFRASFNGSLNADYSNMRNNGIVDGGHSFYESQAAIDAEIGPGKITAEHAAVARLMVPQSLQDYYLSISSPGTKPMMPGNLYHDGAYSEAHRSLLFPAGNCEVTGVYGNDQPILGANTFGDFGGNFGSEGSLTMHFKTNWSPERTGRPHTFLDVSSENKWPYMFYSIANAPLSGITTPITLPVYVNGHAPNFDWPIFSNTAQFAPAMDQSVFRLMFNPTRNSFSQSQTVITPYANFSMTYESVAALQGGVYSLQVNPLGRSYFTYSTNHQHLDDVTIASSASLKHHVLGHRWNFFALLWNRTSSPYIRYQLNDSSTIRRGPDAKFFGGAYTSLPPGNDYRLNLWRNHTPKTISSPEILDYQTHDLMQNLQPPGTYTVDNFRRPLPGDDPHVNLMRFGQWARGTANYVADATFDEINIYEEGIPFLGTTWLNDQYELGRYYNVVNIPPAYISPGIQPHKILDIPAYEAVRLRSISSTIYWPNDVIDGLSALDVDGNNDNPSPQWEHLSGADSWDPISFDVWTEDEDWFYTANGSDRGTLNANTPFTSEYGNRIATPTGQTVTLKRNESLRFKLFLNQDPTVLVGTPPVHGGGTGTGTGTGGTPQLGGTPSGGGFGGGGTPPPPGTDPTPIHEAPIVNDVTLYFEYTTPRVINWTWND